jgi:hypothetical protein
LALGLCIAAGLFVAGVVTSSQTPPSTPTTAQIRKNIVDMLQRNPNTPIKVLPDIPGPGGAPRATNTDAAYYAWQEFIALNWANMPVSGTAAKVGDAGARETADPSLQFGQPPKSSKNNYPALVWQTTRHRSEIYTTPQAGSTPTATPVPPNGYVNDPTRSWGYNSSPGYVYPGLTIKPAPAQSPITPGLTPFVNLDEASQIGVNKMYSGAPYSTAAPKNFVLFMAKANYMEYGYIASFGWYNTTLLESSGGTPTNPVVSFANTSGYILTQGQFPGPGNLSGSPSSSGQYLSFPSGTLEFKAAFRVATALERQAYLTGQPIPGGYQAAPIRFYRQTDNTGLNFEYMDALGVLLSLHIIHKTPSAPYFIFATFEHKDDIIGPNGQPVEDANGKLNPNAFTTTKPSPLPSPYVYPSSGTAPAGQYLIDATTPNVIELPSQFIASPTPPTVTVQNFYPGPNCDAGKVSTTQSYYQNTRDGSTSTLPAANSKSASNSYITVNRRRFSIPSQPIVDVNKDIHNLIAAYGYNPTPGRPNTKNVWLNYKLVNVQWVPAGNLSQKTPGDLYGDTSGGAKPFIPVESYYLSNSLVETNLILSAFSGKFANAGDGLSITDFYDSKQTYTNNNTGQTATKSLGDPFFNIYFTGGPYTMGGCMGCHGNTSVNGGSDASFILAGAPFQIEGAEPPPQVMLLRHQSYFRK